MGLAISSTVTIYQNQGRALPPISDFSLPQALSPSCGKSPSHLEYPCEAASPGGAAKELLPRAGARSSSRPPNPDGTGFRLCTELVSPVIPVGELVLDCFFFWFSLASVSRSFASSASSSWLWDVTACFLDIRQSSDQRLFRETAPPYFSWTDWRSPSSFGLSSMAKVSLREREKFWAMVLASISRLRGGKQLLHTIEACHWVCSLRWRT